MVWSQHRRRGRRRMTFKIYCCHTWAHLTYLLYPLYLIRTTSRFENTTMQMVGGLTLFFGWVGESHGLCPPPFVKGGALFSHSDISGGTWSFSWFSGGNYVLGGVSILISSSIFPRGGSIFPSLCFVIVVKISIFIFYSSIVPFSFRKVRMITNFFDILWNLVALAKYSGGKY